MMAHPPHSAGRRIRTSAALALAVIALMLVIAGCGGSSPADTTTTAASSTTVGGATTTVGGATTTVGGGTTVNVAMKNRAFNPETITIKAGDTVVWTNEDAAQHDVVAENGEFKSELFGRGETFSFTFETPGTYPYVCTVHPGMAGTVIVE